MIKILRPIIFAFLMSDAVKKLVIDLLEAYAAETETSIDDVAVEMVKKGLGYEEKATEDQFNELHNLVTKEFLARIKSGEATTQDLKAACDWLKTNDISGVAYDGNPLDKLANLMPEIDPDLVQERLYGKSHV